jgi:small GTP-binding protein
MKNELLSPRMCYRINFIGDHKSGKTTIIKNNLELNIQDDITISPNIYSKNYQIENKLYKFLIIDTPGHTCLTNMTEMYYNNYDCLVIVLDILNERSFEQLPMRISRIEELNKDYNNNDKVIFLLANFKKNTIIDDTKFIDFSKRYNFYYLKYYMDDHHIFYKIFDTIINHKIHGKPRLRLECSSTVNKPCFCHLM